MFKTMRNAFSIPELRNKILFTLAIVVVFRFGCTLPVPFLNTEALQSLMATVNSSGSLLSYMNMLTGGAFSNATLFAMGVSPYINASIIIQLLTVAIPALEEMSKNGEEGRKKLGAITRYTTVGLGLVQGTAYFFYLFNNRITLYNSGFPVVFSAFVIVLSFTAGTALTMWLGELINNKGIGNGISILLLAGILAQLPRMFVQLWGYLDLAIQNPSSMWRYFIFVPLFILLFLAVIWVIIFMNDAERRVPIQYAKRVMGRKMYGGQSTNLGIKVAMSGVMPIIFANSILSIPSTIQFFLGSSVSTGFWKGFFDAFSSSGWLYSVLYFILILVFAYFYMSIQYNPREMANNLRDNNGAIPGIRPGKPTEDFISKILYRITLIGALFLAVIALMPIIYGNLASMQALSLGGTSIIIMVGVALETVQQLENQMLMRHYKGFLD